MRHFDLLQRFPLKIIGGKKWIQKLLEVVKTPNKANQNPKTQLSSTVRPVSEQPPGLLTKEIKKKTGRLVKSCVPVSVERVDQDTDADENVDADPVRTGRLVESEQSIGLFTQREEIDIDFSRVSGLPHAVVKQAGNFRFRELVKKIESHPHREALQAD